MASRDTLSDYREKRSPGRTPEPFGGEAAAGAGMFVVQKHAATRTHYDLRLEMDGVLKSWAVPKGPSTDPAEKRLAVHVEDHPIEYGDFEGVIPEGEYGAGPVIVWDRGRWIPWEDPAEGMEKGKLLFELRGYKLRGVWALVKLAKSETGNEWLLIRERKGPEPPLPDERIPDTSILSGLEVDRLAEWRAGELDPGAEVRRELEALEEAGAGVRRRRVAPRKVKLMLARTREEPFDDPEWLFELKLDGYRMLAARTEDGPLLLTRNGKEATATFPELRLALGKLPFEHVVLDGEVVVTDEAGIPRFQLIQKRAQQRRALDIHHTSILLPATFYAFDLLGFEDFDLRGLPLAERRRLLALLVPAAGPVRYSEHFEGLGTALYEQVEEMNLEGIMAKRADSPYRGGRSGHWLKIRADRTEDFAVVGFTEPAGTRSGFGALHVAWCVDGEFRYAGKVGTGFSEAQLAELRGALEAARRDDPPCTGPVPRGKENVWVEPRLVARVRYREWTEEGLLRQPAFLGRNEDREPRDCTPDAGGPAPPGLREELDEVAEVEDRPPPPAELPLSNLDKVFWAEDGYTKGNLLDYYRAIAPWLLPWLANRPLVLTRYPDGIDGKSFFQKDAPGFVPEWIRTERIHSEGGERDIDYFIVEDQASLLYLVNLGTIPLHIWASRTVDLERPDWCVLDLDPKEAPFEDVVEIARATRALCDEIGLPAYAKTTGSTGMHVLIPLARRLEHEEAKTLGELLARVLVSELPEIATLVRNPAKREGKVYLDYVQNGRGKTIVAPYSVRPRAGATVSAPLRWSEVKKGLDRERFTIESMPRRMRAMREDPGLAVLEDEPDLLEALRRLHERLEGR